MLLQVLPDNFHWHVELQAVGEENGNGDHYFYNLGQPKNNPINKVYSMVYYEYTYTSSFGKFNVILGSVNSPYFKKPKKPTAAYNEMTKLMPVFKTPGQPMK